MKFAGICIIVVLAAVWVIAGCTSPLVPPEQYGTPDPSLNPPQGFAEYGGGTGWNVSGVETEIQPDGKIVILGHIRNNTQENLLLARYTPEGTLDKGFGTDGIVTYPGDGRTRGLGLALQPDGKIVATGYTWRGSQRDVLLLRYLANGTLDPAFGTGGVVTWSSQGSGTDIGFGVAVRGDGDILVAGESANSTSQDTLVLAYTPDGALDTRFGDGGIVISGGPGLDRGFAIAIQPDNKTIVAGSAAVNSTMEVSLLRLNQDGTPDPTFGSGGSVLFSEGGTSPDYGNCVTVGSDGKILVSGAASDGRSFGLLLLRYLPDGTPDRTFGTGGAAVFRNTGSNDMYGYSHAVQPDGKIVVTGYTQNGTAVDLLLARLNTAGSPDPAFGIGGRMIWNGPGNGTDYGNDVALQSDGRIVVTGFSTNGPEEDMLVVRFLP